MGQAEERVTSEKRSVEGIKLTTDGETCVKDGSPEVQVFNFVKSKGSVDKKALEGALGAEVTKVGTSWAMKSRWISVDKATKDFIPAVDSVTDDVQADLKALQ